MARAPKRKAPKGKAKVARSVDSVTRPKGSDPIPMPVPCTCPDCTGEAYGVMFACEDGVHRRISPPQGIGPWVLYWNTTVGNWPYWESVANILPAPAPVQSRKR